MSSLEFRANHFDVLAPLDRINCRPVDSAVSSVNFFSTLSKAPQPAKKSVFSCRVSGLHLFLVVVLALPASFSVCELRSCCVVLRWLCV